MQILKICRKHLYICLLSSACLLLNIAGQVLAETVPVKDLDYSNSGAVSALKSPQKIEQEADTLFYKGVDEPNKKLKEAYLAKALAKYMLLLSMQPDNAVFCTQIGVIHELNGRKTQAKNYFYRAVNLEKLNPFANYYFGEYYFNIKDYHNALKYYKIALKNGYVSYYEVHNRLATVYEKLGDLQKAKDHYTVSLMVNPNQKRLNNKLLLLDKAYYSKKDYVPRQQGAK